jgi:hypothetical protein
MSDRDSGRFSRANSSRKSKVLATIFDIWLPLPCEAQSTVSDWIYQSGRAGAGRQAGQAVLNLPPRRANPNVCEDPSHET